MNVSAGSAPAAPRGLTSMGIFLMLGALAASLAAATLLWPGTVLDRIWYLNPRAYRQLAPMGAHVGILFLVLGAALGTAAIGWFRRWLWGWRLAVAIIAAQILGDFVNILLGRVAEGAVGATLAGALLFYLWRAQTRSVFR